MKFILYLLNNKLNELHKMSNDESKTGAPSCCCTLNHVFTDLNGFQPMLWGNPTHFWQHSIASYWQCRARDEQRHAFVKFTQCSLVLLFCRTCRESFVEYYKHDPFDESQSWTLYLYRVHEFVNRKLCKPSLPLSMLDALYPPEDGRKLSARFVYSFWVQLYLFALNFPPKVNPKSTRHAEVQQTLIDMLDEVIPVLLPPTSAFSGEYIAAYHQLKQQRSTITFTTRDQAFHFVYQLQKHLRMNVFGTTCLETQQYFEQIYRGGPGK